MLRRVDAENRLQTVKEELEFQKNISNEVSTLHLNPSISVQLCDFSSLPQNVDSLPTSLLVCFVLFFLLFPFSILFQLISMQILFN